VLFGVDGFQTVNVPRAEGAVMTVDTRIFDVKPEQAGPITRQGKGYRFDSNGWIYVHIEGDAHERGYQHGFLVAKELDQILKSLKGLTLIENGEGWEYFVNASEQVLVPNIDSEFLDEMKGIADGAQAAGVNISWQEVVAWNGYVELTDYWFPNQEAGKFVQMSKRFKRRDHCSAFIATGSYTADGKVVMAHTTWDVYQWGQFFNEVLDIQPSTGHRMFMQAAPGYIDSFTDYFVTDAGLMGTETTIAGFGSYVLNGIPEFVRIRKAMQYANSLDEMVQIMKDRNNGGYANSWLFADKNTNEIMRYEQGIQYSSVERTKDGYFIGFNGASDPQLRNLEAADSGWYDIRWATGARRVRLTQLMEQYHGKINVAVGEKIMADQYDVYLNKINPSSRTVEGHYELDPMQYWAERWPFTPHGAVDGKVMTTDMANAMSFWARWGNSSGMPFSANQFLTQHIQWDYLKGYLADRPTRAWSVFKAGQE
jgi:hypothetical protein